MTQRRRLGALSVVTALVAGAPGARAEVAAPPALGQSGLEPRLGAQLPLEARFHSSNGSDVALGEVLAGGRPALLVLAYNRCTMLCNLVLRRVARLVPELGLRPGEDYVLVTISIDPRDTPLEASRRQALLLEAAGMSGQPERWTFLVGERPAIDAVAGSVGFRYAWDEQTEQYAHPAVLISMTPGGTVSGYFDGLDPDLEALRASLAGAPASSGLLASVLSSCFRFDAARSRYGAALAWLLRGSAAGLTLGLGVLVWRLGRRRPSPGGERS
jgi:protein SCO1/2